MYNYEIRFLLLEGRFRIRFVSRAKSGFLSMVGSGKSQSGFETPDKSIIVLKDFIFLPKLLFTKIDYKNNVVRS